MTPELRSLLTRAYLTRLAKSKRPILLGPWRSEVGFEALYWIPFLRWWTRTYHVDIKRLHVITRGGAGMLYGLPTVDLYRLRSVDAVRLENTYDQQRTGLQKQVAVTEWDRQVLTEAGQHLLGRGETFHVLHPSRMYWVCSPFWDEQRGMQYLVKHTDYEPIHGIKPLQQELPASYVAMKWYDRATLPIHDPQVQRTISSLVATVGAQAKIVLLTGTQATDDHADLVIQHPSIVTVPAAAPDQNLAQQIQILSKAQAFIGTYGGMAQLALRLGIPSVSLYKDWAGTAHAHLALSSLVSKKTKVPFLVGSCDDVEGWKRVISLPVSAGSTHTYSMEQLKNATV